MSCMLTLEEIEIKRQELERHLEDVMAVEHEEVAKRK